MDNQKSFLIEIKDNLGLISFSVSVKKNTDFTISLFKQNKLRQNETTIASKLALKRQKKSIGTIEFLKERFKEEIPEEELGKTDLLHKLRKKRIYFRIKTEVIPINNPSPFNLNEKMAKIREFQKQKIRTNQSASNFYKFGFGVKEDLKCFNRVLSTHQVKCEQFGSNWQIVINFFNFLLKLQKSLNRKKLNFVFESNKVKTVQLSMIQIKNCVEKKFKTSHLKFELKFNQVYFSLFQVLKTKNAKNEAKNKIKDVFQNFFFFQVLRKKIIGFTKKCNFKRQQN